MHVIIKLVVSLYVELCHSYWQNKVCHPEGKVQFNMVCIQTSDEFLKDLICWSSVSTSECNSSIISELLNHSPIIRTVSEGHQTQQMPQSCIRCYSDMKSEPRGMWWASCCKGSGIYNKNVFRCPLVVVWGTLIAECQRYHISDIVLFLLRQHHQIIVSQKHTFTHGKSWGGEPCLTVFPLVHHVGMSSDVRSVPVPVFWISNVTESST